MENKKVAVIMSTYNGEKFIREQLDSILNQTYKNIEIVVRDDGSKDGTVSIVKEYMQKYPNIILYEGENLGFIIEVKIGEFSRQLFRFSSII